MRRDWRERAAKLDAFLLGPAQRAGFVWWTAGNPTPLLPPGAATLAVASYANASTFKPGSSEGLPIMGSVLGAAVARVGERNVTRAEAATVKYVAPALGIFRDFPNAATGVSCHDITGIWLAFFSRCQRYRCGQGFMQTHARPTVGRSLGGIVHIADVK